MATNQDALVFVDMINGKWHIGTPESLQRMGIALLEKEDSKPDELLGDK